jgi:hypothetical protein
MNILQILNELFLYLFAFSQNSDDPDVTTEYTISGKIKEE